MSLFMVAVLVLAVILGRGSFRRFDAWTEDASDGQEGQR